MFMADSHAWALAGLAGLVRLGRIIAASKLMQEFGRSQRTLPVAYAASFGQNGVCILKGNGNISAW
jgi:hypothetical protein